MANAYYTGVGSRKCSHKDGLILTQIGMSMASKGIILRSGGAVGADTYFEMGCERWWDVSAADPLADIYVTEKRPRVWQHDWRKNVLILDEFPPEIVAEATELARNVHPNWGAMNDYGRSLHTRNAMQVLGSDLKTPSSFLVCAAPFENSKGTPTGGTRTAWKIAQNHNIECFNITIPSQLEGFRRFIDFFL